MPSFKPLKASIIIGGSVSGAFKSALGTTRNGLKQIGEEIANVERRQRLMGRSIDTFGKMGRNVDHLRLQYAGLTREADKLRAAQSRLANVQGRIDANNARRQELGGKLRGAATTFGVVAAATIVPVRSAVAFESAMLGVAKQVNGARDAGGNLTPVYFAMAKQIQQLGREIPIATNELADMVAAGARMGVAKDELIGFTRTAAMMADAFELPAGQLADDMGKIAGLFKIPIPRIGELADAINFLDDNAKSTGGDIINVMSRIGGMADTLKMPAKEAAALGSTFLTLGSSAEIAGTAANAAMRILGTASMQSKRVRSGIAAIGMTPAALQSSMAKDATGTILRVLDALNKLNREQRMVASTQIFGAEYGDDLAKLAGNADEYRRQLALVNGEQMKGSVSREFSARLGTMAAQWQITKNRMNEAAVVIGSALVPALQDLMTTAAPAIEGLADWTRANPGFVKGIVGSALALSGLRVATLGLGYAWTTVKAPVLSVMGFVARWRATGALASLGRFGPLAMRVASGFRVVGAAIAAIGGGPIAAIVGAVTVGALVVRKYWQPIGAFLSGMFAGIRDTVGPAFAELGAALAPLKPAWDAVAGAIGAAWGWVVKLLEPVNMTSTQLQAAGNAGRVFGQAIAFSMGVAIRAITTVVKGITWVVNNIGKVASAASMIPGVGGVVGLARYALGGDDASTAAAPRRGLPAPARGKAAPAVGAAKAAPARGEAAPQSHVYNIMQLPGESGDDLARRVAAAHKRQAAVDKRGSLVDAA